MIEAETNDLNGDVLYYNGSAWAWLPAGSSGQFLQTQGSSANPQWAILTAGYHGAGAANNSNYSTSSTSYVDVDATNLKFTISGLVIGQFVMARVSFEAANAASTTNAVALMDVTNSTVIYGVTPTGSTGSFGFDGLYKVRSTSITFSLQFRTTSGTCTVINSATTWIFSTGSVVPTLVIIPLN